MSNKLQNHQGMVAGLKQLRKLLQGDIAFALATGSELADRAGFSPRDDEAISLGDGHDAQADALKIVNALIEQVQ